MRALKTKQRREEDLATAQTTRDESLISQQTAHLTLTKQQQAIAELNEKMKTKDEAVIMQRIEVNRPVLTALNGALKPEVRHDSRAGVVLLSTFGQRESAAAVVVAAVIAPPPPRSPLRFTHPSSCTARPLPLSPSGDHTSRTGADDDHRRGERLTPPGAPCAVPEGRGAAA